MSTLPKVHQELLNNFLRSNHNHMDIAIDKAIYPRILNHIQQRLRRKLHIRNHQAHLQHKNIQIRIQLKGIILHIDKIRVDLTPDLFKIKL